MASCAIDVYVKLPSGKAISSQHVSSNTVRQIAAQVAKGEGISEARIRLKYQGKVLDKSKTIGYLGICAETILKAEVLFPKEIIVIIKFPEGKSESVCLQNLDTVYILKQRIEDMCGLTKSSQIIKTNSGQTLNNDNDILCDHGVVDDSVLTVSKKTEVKSPDSDNSVISDEVDEDKKMELLNTFDAGGRNVEVVFCFDTTGSMYSCLSTVRAKLRQTCRRLLNDVQNMRIGIMAVGDYCDYNEYVVRYVDLTSDVDTLVDFAENVKSTGGGDAPEVRNKLRETCNRLFRDIPEIRIGIMANGDYCDFEKYVVRYVDLTRNVDTVVEFAKNVSSTGGGGNGGEAYEWALRKAQQLDWSEDSAKALVMIGDELPHAPSYTDQNLFWKDELDVLAGMGVKVYGVQALNRGESVPFYEELAERTNGYYLELKDFNLITDMFLAVCYREAAPEQLDAFLEEVESEGRMTENTKLFLDKLDESKTPENKPETEKQTRYVASEWWDKSLAKMYATPQYKYDQTTDDWRPYNNSFTDRFYPPPAPKKLSKWRRVLKIIFRKD